MKGCDTIRAMSNTEQGRHIDPNQTAPNEGLRLSRREFLYTAGIAVSGLVVGGAGLHGIHTIERYREEVKKLKETHPRTYEEGVEKVRKYKELIASTAKWLGIDLTAASATAGGVIYASKKIDLEEDSKRTKKTITIIR